MSVSSTRSTKSSGSVAVTRKPWFLTCVNGDVLPWKDGVRLKLRDGQSAGRIRAVSLLNENEKTITLLGTAGDGSQQYKLHCCLGSFQGGANSFCSALSKEDPFQFAKTLAENSNVLDETSLLCSNPRKRKTVGELGKAKRRALPRSQNDDEISNHHIGTLRILVTAMREPRPSLQVRDVKKWYVEFLSEAMQEDREDLSSPFLVICSVSKEEFISDLLASYSYEVIGGVQRYFALKEMSQKGHEIVDRRCVVYGHGISQAAALTLAQRHYETNFLRRATSFPEIAGTCRRLMFAEFGDELEDTVDGIMPPVPRYNTQSYRDFKTKCLAILVNTQTSEAMVEQAIQMALQPCQIYHLMQQVFLKYEEGTLKDQKRKEMKGISLQKALEGRFSAKLTQFKIFQGLKDDQKITLLKKLMNGTLSFSDVEKQSSDMKSLENLKESFQKEAGIAWEDAIEGKPEYADHQVLKKFKVAKGKAPPKEFKMFCEKFVTEKTSSPPKESSTNEMVVTESQLLMIPFKDTSIVFYDMSEVLSEKQFKTGITGLCISIEDAWMAVFYNSNCLITSDIQAVCKHSDAKNTRVITVCSLLRSDGDIQLGYSKEIVIAWWGDYYHPICQIDDVNTIIINPEDDDTMVSTQSAGWMEYLISKSPEKPEVADLFSQYGEMKQLSNKMKIKCIVAQRSKGAEEGAEDESVKEDGGSQDNVKSASIEEEVEEVISNPSKDKSVEHTSNEPRPIITRSRARK